MAFTNVAATAGMFPAWKRNIPNQLPTDTLVQQFIDDTAGMILAVLERRFGEAIQANASGVFSAWLYSLGLPNVPSAWAKKQAIPANSILIDSGVPADLFSTTALGITGTIQPTWPTTVGQTVLDPISWPAGLVVVLGDQIVDPANHLQEVTTPGTTGAVAPAFNDAGGTTADNTVVWQDRGICATRLTWTAIAPTNAFRVLESGNRFGAAVTLGVILASYGVTNALNLVKFYEDNKWSPFINQLQGLDKNGKQISGGGMFDSLFDSQASVISPRPGLIGIPGGDRPWGVTAYEEGLSNFFSKFGVDYGNGTPDNGWEGGGPGQGGSI